MKVIINEGGLTCSTLNPLGEKPPVPFTSPDLDEWKKAESERQTFEIANQGEYQVVNLITGEPEEKVYKFEPGTTHEAEIVNGKAVIK